MTDEAWVRGFGELILAFPNREQTTVEATARAQLYRKHLDTLSDEQWGYAVRLAILRDGWFPTVARLLEFGESYTPPAAGYLGPAPRTQEQEQVDREAARKGLELVKAAVAERGLPILPPPSMPEPVVVVAHDDRLDDLRRQREKILSEEP